MQNFLDAGIKGIRKFPGVEAYDAITGLSQPGITVSVSSDPLRGEVVFSINFYDQLGGVDGEIRYIWAYLCLPANVNSIEFSEFSEIAPEPFFPIGHTMAKLSRPCEGPR